MSGQACILWREQSDQQSIIDQHMRHLPDMVSRMLKQVRCANLCMNEEGSKAAWLLVFSVVNFSHWQGTSLWARFVFHYALV